MSRTQEVRVYYREPFQVGFDTETQEPIVQWHPRGLAVARWNNETDRIDIGFALCSDKDAFSRKMATRIALGRLNTGDFNVNPEMLNSQLQLELPPAINPDGSAQDFSPFDVLLPELTIACNEVIQRQQYQLTRAINEN